MPKGCRSCHATVMEIRSNQHGFGGLACPNCVRLRKGYATHGRFDLRTMQVVAGSGVEKSRA
jgi:hypothetical protein